ncbi:MAG: hypothetical protein EOO75_14515 [Myxococcales bacterium]|nr:MAG: hypothetical protein EOO75_14515 [Myxococcales bacterium]
MTMRSAAVVVLGATMTMVGAGCGSSAAVKAAERGDYAALRAALAQEQKDGQLDRGEARAVANAVVRREVSEGKGDDGVARVNELRGCAEQARDVLDDRSEKSDEPAAASALLLLDEQLAGSGRWRKRASDSDPGWRAVGARSLVDDDEEGDERRALFNDMVTSVRRAAFRASFDAGDGRDRGLLLEAVRVDPDDEVRATAARSVGRMADQDVVLALKDRWYGSSDLVRASIVRAWATSSSYGRGGREQLFWVAESDRGSTSLTAATLLLRHAGDDGAVGRGAMLRALDEGATPLRVAAINQANLGDEAQLELVKKASEAGDGQVKVAALSRLVERKDSRARSLEELATVAQAEGPARNAARSALARARDRRVVTLLADDTRATEPGVRAWAASELAAMHEFPHAAQTLADDDVSVRTRAACAILASSH